MKMIKKDYKEANKEIGNYLSRIIQKAATGNYETGTDANGAAAVGTHIEERIFSQLEPISPIWDRIQKVKSTVGNVIKIRSRVNKLQYEPTSGIRTYWVEECDAATASKMRFKAQTLTLKKLITLCPATAELEEDVEQLGSVFAEDASLSTIAKIERDILLGTGSIKGITQSGGNDATIGVTLSSDITEAEIKAFVDALHPNCYQNAIWLVTPQQYSAILDINFTTANVLQFYDNQYYLFGFPIYVAPLLTASPYNVVLGDFSKYVVAYITPKVDMAKGLRVYEDETLIRMEMRIAGNTFAETLVCDDGNTYGFFVVGGMAPGVESSSSSSSSSEDYSESSSSSSEDYSESSLSSDLYSLSSASSATSQSVSSESSESSSESSESEGNESSSSSSVDDTHYRVSGTLTPDAQGDYHRFGTYGSEFSYVRDSGTYYLWYSTTENAWVISPTIGDVTPSWVSIDGTITGDFEASAGYDGTATVVEI